jgi:hypothetical protein
MKRYVCGDCGSPDYACAGWNGKGYPYTDAGLLSPNHNLQKECPPKIEECPFRTKKTPSKPWAVRSK